MRRTALVLVAALVILTAPGSAGAAGPSTDDEFYGVAGDDGVGDVRVVKGTRHELTQRQREGLTAGDILTWQIEVDRRAPNPHLLAHFGVKRAVHRGEFPQWWRQQFGVRIVHRADDGTKQQVKVVAGARGTSAIPPREPVSIFKRGRFHSYCRAAEVIFDRQTDHVGIVVPLRCITRTGMEEGAVRGFVVTFLEGIGDDPKGTGQDKTSSNSGGPLIPVPPVP